MHRRLLCPPVWASSLAQKHDPDCYFLGLDRKNSPAKNQIDRTSISHWSNQITWKYILNRTCFHSFIHDRCEICLLGYRCHSIELFVDLFYASRFKKWTRVFRLGTKPIWRAQQPACNTPRHNRAPVSLFITPNLSFNFSLYPNVPHFMTTVTVIWISEVIPILLCHYV